MNKHIELVKKWLANPASVSQQELKDNRNAADAAAADAAYAAAAYRVDSVSPAAAATFAAADAAAAAYAYADAADAAYWVKRYEELTK